MLKSTISVNVGWSCSVRNNWCCKGNEFICLMSVQFVGKRLWTLRTFSNKQDSQKAYGIWSLRRSVRFTTSLILMIIICMNKLAPLQEIFSDVFIGHHFRRKKKKKLKKIWTSYEKNWKKSESQKRGLSALSFESN